MNEQLKSEQLQCYHLDLKPQNILVFEMGCNDIWKISDFGISKIKTVPHGQSDLASKHLLVKIFKPKNIMTPVLGLKMHDLGGHMPLLRPENYLTR